MKNNNNPIVIIIIKQYISIYFFYLLEKEEKLINQFEKSYLIYFTRSKAAIGYKQYEYTAAVYTHKEKYIGQ
jgi:hypothetical protein